MGPTKKFAPTSTVWKEECDRAFRQLKFLLCSSAILYSPDHGKEFVLKTVAPNQGT